MTHASRPSLSLAGLALWVLVVCGLAAAAAQGPPTLAEADRQFAARRFFDAARGYETGGVPPERRDEVQFRRVAALGRAARWGEALDASTRDSQASALARIASEGGGTGSGSIIEGPTFPRQAAAPFAHGMEGDPGLAGRLAMRQ